MAIEIVSLPMKNGGSFHSYVNVYQRVFVILGSANWGAWTLRLCSDVVARTGLRSALGARGWAGTEKLLAVGAWCRI